jgi:hypothetical protein
MEREHGVKEALGFVRRSDFNPPEIAFDSTFEKD